MCQKRNSVLWNGHRVDSCMRSGLESFERYGMKTLACCCGHGVYPETIICEGVVEGVDKGTIVEFNSQKIIPRKKRFYLKDSQGFFYIPEVSKPKGKCSFCSEVSEEIDGILACGGYVEKNKGSF